MVPRLLVVAFSNSVHTERWLEQFAGLGWDIQLFPSVDVGLVRDGFRDLTVHHSLYSDLGRGPHPSVRTRGLYVPSRRWASVLRQSLHGRRPWHRVQQLGKLIRDWRPHLVHALEFQHAGYLVDDARRWCQQQGIAFPRWLVTNWGSDLYLFGRLPDHRARIAQVLQAADYYSCECQRDVQLARDHGFTKRVMAVFPNTGGFDLALAERLRAPGPTSARRVIALKGYQGWAGRCLVGLRALRRCADLLAGYEIVLYSVQPAAGIEEAAALLTADTGVPTRYLPNESPHEAVLRLHGSARISLGLSISDAISTSFLEALVMGAFPIQSHTACADEWVTCGHTGFLVPPEDPDVIEARLRVALTEDRLVDQAAAENWETVTRRLAAPLVRAQALAMYQDIFRDVGVT